MKEITLTEDQLDDLIETNQFSSAYWGFRQEFIDGNIMLFEPREGGVQRINNVQQWDNFLAEMGIDLPNQ